MENSIDVIIKREPQEQEEQEVNFNSSYTEIDDNIKPLNVKREEEINSFLNEQKFHIKEECDYFGLQIKQESDWNDVDQTHSPPSSSIVASTDIIQTTVKSDYSHQMLSKDTNMWKDENPEHSNYTMNCDEQEQFKHSEKVPQIFKQASKCLRKIIENGSNIKETVYSQRKHINLRAMYALVSKTVQNYSQINDIIARAELLVKETRFDPWLARILVTQLLWSDNGLNGQCRPIEIIKSYQSKLERYAGSNMSVQARVYKPRYVRVNTFALTVDEAIDGFTNEGWEFVEHAGDDYSTFVEQTTSLHSGQFMLDLHIKELLIFSDKAELYNHETFKCKSIFLQDKASCIPVHLLNPTPGTVVLNMCAAPGLKTIFLAERLQNKGTVYAVERDENRYHTLTSLINETGATCIKPIHKDVLKVSAEECPNVEYILINPICSGSGIIDRINVDQVNTVNHDRLTKLIRFQTLLLEHALSQFPQAKRVVYSTSSIHWQENEYVVRNALKKMTDFKLISPDAALNHTFVNICPNQCFKAIQKKCVYTVPKRDLTNAIFVAVFERKREVDASATSTGTRGWLSRHRTYKRNSKEMSRETDQDYQRDFQEDFVETTKSRRKEY
ncbi:hypothetical protein PPYR_12194 [Photinus pyralis]|uniref:SAM-dependent MTase RsmB/NOP-type domain-containing protein n=3 Tax=Photinus pyralis TaxID=7054 RepID=A0A5N4ADF8_PHOPY|nr:hypothetical protein PPYR_12194 [Photinus pyralis]